jgi:hypothetical protein
MFRRAAACVVVAALAAAVAVPLPAARADEPKPAAPQKSIDLVLCLDVSNSMNGLIDSAKIRLWDIVNELARLKPTPKLRVALYSYGHSTYPASNGWVRKDADLTEDLDELYRVLNALTINGGTEYVARVTRAALTEQKWTEDPGSLKLIFVCGNEPADQDKQVTLDEVAAQAKKQGVIVNTIYCKYGRDAEIPGWEAFAEQCGGRHINIDQNRAVHAVVVKTEYDAEILKLDAEVSKTYVPYGKGGDAKKDNQLAQDRNAAKAAPSAPGSAPAAALGRAEFKAGGMYRNSTWDLVDRMKEKDFDLSKIPEDELCEEMRKLKPEERLAYLKKKAEERAELQKKIGELSAKRAKKVAEEQAKQPKAPADKALDEAVKGTVRDQAKAKGFETPEEKK